MDIDQIVSRHTMIMQTVRGRPAVIARGNATCAATVVLGRSNNGALTKNDMVFEMDAQDFLVPFEEYAPGGCPVEPLLDDTITVDKAGYTCVYEVRMFADSEQCFAADATGRQLRVHCKLMSKESIS